MLSRSGMRASPQRKVPLSYTKTMSQRAAATGSCNSRKLRNQILFNTRTTRTDSHTRSHRAQSNGDRHVPACRAPRFAVFNRAAVEVADEAQRAAHARRHVTAAREHRIHRRVVLLANGAIGELDGALRLRRLGSDRRCFGDVEDLNAPFLRRRLLKERSSDSAGAPAAARRLLGSLAATASLPLAIPIGVSRSDSPKMNSRNERGCSVSY